MELALRQVIALERIALEASAIQDTLDTLIHFNLGGMTPAEVEAAKHEAKALKQSLRQSRKALGAAIAAQQQGTKQ